MPRWRRAMADMVPAAIAFVLLFSACYLTANVSDPQIDGALELFVACAIGPLAIAAILVPLAAGVMVALEASRWRSTALVLVAFVAAALGIRIDAWLTSWIWTAPSTSTLAAFWGNFGFASAFSVAAALIHDSRVRALERAAALRAVRLARARVLRQTAETRLAALQARVDPRFLFDVLAAVERTYVDNPPAGDRLLEDLIVYLRAALPDVSGARSTLGREIDLAYAWLGLQRSLRGHAVSGATSVSDEARQARFPPAIVVPLLNALLAGTSRALAVTVAASREGARLLLRIGYVADDGAAEAAGILSTLRERLRDIFGGEAHVAFAAGTGQRGEFLLEIPYERAG